MLCNLSDSLISALLGGALIGCAATLLLLLNGRLAGISNIAGSVWTEGREEGFWRTGFLSGLLLGGLSLLWLAPESLSEGPALPLPLLAAAGLLVGLGAGMGRGCTSGHGICGLSRRSPRSLAATATFMLVAMATVFWRQHV